MKTSELDEPLITDNEYPVKRRREREEREDEHYNVTEERRRGGGREKERRGREYFRRTYTKAFHVSHLYLKE